MCRQLLKTCLEMTYDTPTFYHFQVMEILERFLYFPDRLNSCQKPTHMKILHSIAFLIIHSIGLPAFSQTQSLEYDTMMNRYLAKEFTQLEFKDLSFAWRDLTDSIGYPEVPYDSVSKKVEYIYENALDEIPRETIVNRSLEWAAVTFGSTDALLTSQDNTSRIIMNGSVEILFPDMFMVWKNSWRGYVETEQLNSSICFFTMVFTIREGKMKSQIINISYQYTDFVSDRSISRTLNSCFPISNNEQEEWKALITLVNETRESLSGVNDLVVAYIKDYENDYNL